MRLSLDKSPKISKNNKIENDFSSEKSSYAHELVKPSKNEATNNQEFVNQINISEELNLLVTTQHNMDQRFEALQEVYKTKVISNSKEMFLLGKAYLDGTNGFNIDVYKAHYWLGIAVKQNYFEAKSLFESLDIKLNGSPEELYNYGLSFIPDDKTEDNQAYIDYHSEAYINAFEYVELSANNNYVLAQNRLGHFYFYGLGTAQNYQKAVICYQKASSQNYPVADCNLGVCYQYGYGITKNIEEALYLYRKSAKLNNLNALNNLGICYANGIGVEKNVEKAVEFFRKSAEQGNSNAQNNLGISYANGVGIKQDLEKAVHWYRKSAEQGYADAQYHLGVCYLNSKGVKENYQEGIKWLQKATEQNHSSAQNNLAWCYENGKGIAINLEKAMHWYQKAIAQGHNVAKKNLEKLLEKHK